MKNSRMKRILILLQIGVGMVLGSVVSPTLSGTVNLADMPLTKVNPTTALPNLMFILDTSGSMDWNYLPDWVNTSVCKNTSGSYNLNCTNQPPFLSPDFNSIYYNPEIRYEPPLNADGTSRPSQTSWTSVKNDAYNKQDTGSTNLVTGYPDREWCTSTSYTDCLRNDNYILPGVVDGKSYTVSRAVNASGSGKVVSGPPNDPTTSTRSFGPYYYQINPGEYCDSERLTNCQPTMNGAFMWPAKLRWCNNSTNAAAATPAAGSCQGLRVSGFTVPRYPTRFFTPGVAAVPAVPAVPASVTLSFSMSGCNSSRKAGVKEIIVAGVGNILSSQTSDESSNSNLASKIRGTSALHGYSFSGSSNSVKITAPEGAGNLTATVTLTRTSSSHSSCTFSPTSGTFSGYKAPIDGQPAIPPAYYGSFSRVDIVTGSTYPRAAGRTDCVTSSDYCTYAEEMTNFANWWTYYQTRLQAMKTAVSRAFKTVDSRYRVGFVNLWGDMYLPITKFDSSVKSTWYNTLFNATPANGTPLRSALGRVGRLYAGKKPKNYAGTKTLNDDPVQYACQKNFTLLTTDGYWNTDDSNSLKVNIQGNAAVGNLDGPGTAKPKWEGPTATSNTLSDIAKYYYDTDIRDTSFGNCTGAESLNVCDDGTNVGYNKQFMTTFTLGLGVDGTLFYQSDYQTASSGDFRQIELGNLYWPVPTQETETAVDDLWHAAVNGGGQYFSAKDPSTLASSLSGVLTAIDATVGAGAAAATSTLNPIAGDNFAYVASYTTAKWIGNLEARTINLQSGEVSATATWCAENVQKTSCEAPRSLSTETVNGSAVTYCVATGATAANCATDGGIFNSSDSTCKVEMVNSCTGTMQGRVAAASDDRKIYVSNGAGMLTDFTYANLPSGLQTYFQSATLSGLSQWTSLSASQKSNAVGVNFVNYLRGQTQYENRSSNSAENRLFRVREATLGDATESQPAFVGKPVYGYTDAGYLDKFVVNQKDRPRTVFLGTNDGMLHAFDAENGTERWAYVPSMVIPNLWRLASFDYANNHRNYVNGSPQVADVHDPSKPADDPNGGWRTILVAGLNGGGKGYYALDITDPTTPKLLWELTPGSDGMSKLGFTFGHPIITKRLDGKWVVLLTSGYNNGDTGYLYVRDALTGNQIDTLATTGGMNSGLAKISAWADEPTKNNTVTYAYGGDLEGYLWRFDINTSDLSKKVLKFATLLDPSDSPQPITTKPELGLIKGKRTILVGTGKFLEELDIQTDQKQTLYVIKDDDAASTFVNPRKSSDMVQQTITTTGNTRKVSANPVDHEQMRGCFVDLPEQYERAHVDSVLSGGAWIVPTTVPTATICSASGHGWINYFDYRTCGTLATADDGLAGKQTDAPIVGINVYYLPPGQQGDPKRRVVSVVKANNPTPTGTDGIGNSASGGFTATRVMWRELLD